MERKGPSFSIPSHYRFVFLSSLSENRFDWLLFFLGFQGGVHPWGARPIFRVTQTGMLRGSDLVDCASFEGPPNSRSRALSGKFDVTERGGCGSF